MNSNGELFASDEEGRNSLKLMTEEQIRLTQELEEKQRQALMDIPYEDAQRIISMNRAERRKFYRQVTKKRGKGYTR